MRPHVRLPQSTMNSVWLSFGHTGVRSRTIWESLGTCTGWSVERSKTKCELWGVGGYQISLIVGLLVCCAPTDTRNPNSANGARQRPYHEPPEALLGHSYSHSPRAMVKPVPSFLSLTLIPHSPLDGEDPLLRGNLIRIERYLAHRCIYQ